MLRSGKQVLKLAIALALLNFASLGNTQAEQKNKPMLGEWGVETQYFSKNVSPGDDFYTYVNEGWLQITKLPQGLPRMDSFVEVHLRSEAQIKAIIDDLLEGKTLGVSGGQQIKDLYQSYMDKSRIEALGLSPIQAELDAVLETQTHTEVARWMAEPLHKAAIGMAIDLDEKKPDHYTLIVTQGDLSLPERVYYLSNQEPFPQIRSAYTDYIEGVFSNAGIDRPRDRADAVVAFETAIAKYQWTPEAQRDRLKNYNPMTKDELIAYAPGFDWVAFMDALQVGDHHNIIVKTDTAVKDTAALINKTPVDVLRSYLAFHFINNQAPLLPKVYADAHFDFFSRRLNGISEQRARPLRAQRLVNENLGEVLGRMYVARYFPAAHKAAIEKYIPFIREAFRQHLKKTKWMDDTTKKAAYAKLDSFVTKIGHPDKWRDFSSITIKPGELIGNNRRIQHWHFADTLSKLGKPRRQWEWTMNPQEVNAYYAPSRNEIVFPAAIMQPPFFDPHADPAVNFGAIGAVIGHEMGHGFDDQGSRSDGKGVLRDWWTPESRQQFEQRAKVLVDQYNAYEPIEGTKVNGQLTLGENIGDLGGLAIAYSAYQNFMKDEYDGQAPKINRLTGNQRFFLSWGQLWRSMQTKEFQRKNLLSDPHSPGQYRVNGIVRNTDAWYNAFDVTEKDRLYLPPEKRVTIW